MNLRQSAGKIVKLMKNLVGERQLDERRVGEHALDLAAERRVDAEIVVHPQEAARGQVAPQIRDLERGELDVAVAAGEYEGVLKERGRAGLDHRLLGRRDGDRAAIAQRVQQG